MFGTNPMEQECCQYDEQSMLDDLVGPMNFVELEGGIEATQPTVVVGLTGMIVEQEMKIDLVHRYPSEVGDLCLRLYSSFVV
ncbi:unnamed protein product [Lactuca virosa]|uniref:Uncharacterized protein n=1 Tax=Lactuca virosa TaxID=75947 RepID=A0AAU9LMD5_9ASTR|nr:unnamed protein product [Lactuca virosa]